MARNGQWERILAIHALLAKNRSVTRRSLAQRMEVTIRTIQRDMDDLRDKFGAPLAYSREEGYRYTEPNWVLPAALVSEGDLFSLLIARQAVAQYRGTPLATRLTQIFNKIAGPLSSAIHIHPDFVQGGVLSFAPVPVLDVNERIWNQTMVAIRSQRSAYVSYHSRNSRELSERRIDPCHILNMQGDWYLYAYDHQRRRVCQFQLHRIREITLLQERFEMPEGFDIAAITNSSFGSFGNVEQMKMVRLRIKGAMGELLTDRIFHQQQVVSKRRDGFEIAFPVSAAGSYPFYNLIQWILSMGRDVEIRAPRQLKRLVQAEIEAMQKNIRK